MMIAQLTFRGMPLAQGMTLANMIRLHEIQDNEVHCLLEAVRELPISHLPEKHITLGRHTFTSTGEVVGHLIALGLAKKLSIEEIGLFTRIVGWILTNKLAPQQVIDILSDAIQRALPNVNSMPGVKACLDEAGCILPDKIWTYRNIEPLNARQNDRRKQKRAFQA